MYIYAIIEIYKPLYTGQYKTLFVALSEHI